MRNRYSSIRYLALAVVATLIASCGSDESDPECLTSVDQNSYSSPLPGALTLNGHFFANESVVLTKVVNGAQSAFGQGTPATDRTSFTLTGLPSGTHQLFIRISCGDGESIFGPFPFTVS